MLKMIMNQRELELHKKYLANWEENVCFSLDAEFSKDDKRYNNDEEVMICISVTHEIEEGSKQELEIELGTDLGSVYELSDDELNTIKSQLIEAGLLDYQRTI